MAFPGPDREVRSAGSKGVAIGRRIVVTGGAGFIGSHLVRRLLADDRNELVINLDLLTYAGLEANLAGLPRGRHRLVRGDVADPQAVEAVVPGAEVVINLAAESHVDRSIAAPLPFLQTNVLGTSVLLDACRRHGIPRFVHISTDEVYGPVPEGSVTEDAPLRPSSPYAASKASADHVVGAWATTYGYESIVIRPCNTYGSRQHPEKVIPRFVTNLAWGKPMPLYGDGRHQREWLHVSDTVAAIALLADEGEPGEIYNVGSGSHLPNRDLAARIASHVGVAPDTEHVADRPGHDVRYAVDSTKLRRLGWEAVVGLDEGLAETVEWYIANEAWWRPLIGARGSPPAAEPLDGLS